MTKEIWKPAPGLEPHYEISNLGQVKFTGLAVNGRRTKPRIRNLSKYPNGYVYVGIKHLKTGVLVHRLVAMAFIPNPRACPHVHHVNHSRDDNRAMNLAWVTRQENMDMAVEAGRILKGSDHPSAKLSDEDVVEIRHLLSEGRMTNPKIANKFGITSSMVTCISSGKSWSHLL